MGRGAVVVNNGQVSTPADKDDIAVFCGRFQPPVQHAAVQVEGELFVDCQAAAALRAYDAPVRAGVVAQLDGRVVAGGGIDGVLQRLPLGDEQRGDSHVPRGHGEGIGVVVGNLVLFLRAVHLQRCQFIARVGLDGQGDGVVLRGIVYAGLGRHAAVFAGLDDDVRRGEGDVREVICVAGDVAGIIHLARRVVQVLAGLDGEGLVIPGIHIIAVGFDAVGGIRPAEGDVAVGRVEALTVFAGRGHVAAGDADVADAADGIGLTCAGGVHRAAGDGKAMLAADAISVLRRGGGVHRAARDRDGRLSSAYRKGDNAIAAPGRDAAPGDGNGRCAVQAVVSCFRTLGFDHAAVYGNVIRLYADIAACGGEPAGLPGLAVDGQILDGTCRGIPNHQAADNRLVVRAAHGQIAPVREDQVRVAGECDARGIAPAPLRHIIPAAGQGGMVALQDIGVLRRRTAVRVDVGHILRLFQEQRRHGHVACGHGEGVVRHGHRVVIRVPHVPASERIARRWGGGEGDGVAVVRGRDVFRLTHLHGHCAVRDAAGVYGIVDLAERRRDGHVGIGHGEGILIVADR